MNIADTVKSMFRGMPAMVAGGKPGYRAGEEKLAWSRPDLAAAQAVSVSSDAFEQGQPIPYRYSPDGENISPPLAWSGLPESTQSIALVVEDPDAPTPEPFVHWLLYNISPALKFLSEETGKEEVADLAGGAMQGKNSKLRKGWAGMAPPKGDTPHRYFFQVFALDILLPLDPAAGRTALLNAMAGHVLGRGLLMGTYSRT